MPVDQPCGYPFQWPSRSLLWGSAAGATADKSWLRSLLCDLGLTGGSPDPHLRVLESCPVSIRSLKMCQVQRLQLPPGPSASPPGPVAQLPMAHAPSLAFVPGAGPGCRRQWGPGLYPRGDPPGRMWCCGQDGAGVIVLPVTPGQPQTLVSVPVLTLPALGGTGCREPAPAPHEERGQPHGCP